MKLMMKKTLVAAAIATMAMSGAANAAYFTGGATGNSDLTLSVWDDVAGVGYTFDTGITLNSLFGADNSGAGGTTNNLATAVSTSALGGTIYSGALTGFSTFLTGVGSNLSNSVWNLAAGDNSGRMRVLTTASAADTTSNFTGALKNNYIATTAGNFSTYDTAAGSFVATFGDDFANTVTANGSGYAGGAFWGTTMGTHGLPSANAFGDGSSSDLFLFAQKSTTSANAGLNGTYAQVLTAGGQALTASVFQTAGVWNVTVAAVPEADTYAMLMAGLGLMGFVARRRMQG